MKILITGATGNVGRPLIEHLLRGNDQVTIQAAVTEIATAGHLFPSSRVQPVEFDFLRPEITHRALQGIDKVFLLRPPQLSRVRQEIFPFIDQMQAAGVKQVVFLSLQGVENNKITPHYKIEQYIRQLSLPYTFLRPSFFMQNLTTTHLEEIRDEGRLYLPAGKGATNFVDVREVAEAGAKVFLETGHIPQAYELTGPRAYTYHEITQIISEVTERQIQYQPAGFLPFIWKKWRKGIPLGFAFVMAALYTVARLGKADGYSDELQELLGRPPKDFADFALEHARLWSTEAKTDTPH
jgi:uncharacterized protein YbjT (DUF2867 family)